MELSRSIFLCIICLTLFVFKADCENDFQDVLIHSRTQSIELPQNSSDNFGACNSESVKELHDLVKSCECKPRTHLIDIGIISPSALVFPSLVEVNHCDGSCQGYSCVATETKPLIVTLQKFDFFLDPYKPTCGSIQLQEDVSCQCKCLIKKDDCHENQAFHPDACKCFCPNAEEERQCITEGNKWNRKECTCLNHQ